MVDVKYDRTHSIYWYVIDKADQFDAQETARQVQVGVCTNADNSSAMKKEGFSYEYHYRTKDGLALTDFKIASDANVSAARRKKGTLQRATV